ncbi:MAG TPA: orotidine-5'-phosphate decarboxylase [Alphaproteobacteria bacterium]|nr:orotidine-5'-phosphate decarboxylase [Alphaproteobacteria bacterium]
MNAGERLIVPLDVQNVEEARAIVGRLAGAVTFFKLGPWLLLSRGFERLLDELQAAGNKIFLDTKGCDIPETMRAGAAAAAARGINFLTIHGNADVTDEAMKATVAGKGATDLKILVVTALTSIGPGDLERTEGAAAVVESLVVNRAKRAFDCGCDGVIASAREVKAIRAATSARPFLIVTPGIRPYGAGMDDHKRAASPKEAIAAGADYLVIGRPIIRADDPAQAARRVIEEMQDAFEARRS